jgi:glucose/arabinose dehydrogenase
MADRQMKPYFRRIVRFAVYGLVVCAAAAQTVTHPDLRLQTVVSGFNLPTGIGFLGPQDFLVTEKNTGMVRWVSHGSIQGTVLDLAVNNSSERGLLGIAVHPRFNQNPYVYLFWTCQAPPAPVPAIIPTEQECLDTPATGADTNDILAVPLRGNRVDRFVWNGKALAFDRNIIKLRTFQNDGVPVPPGQNDEGQPPRGNHDGGVLAFGSDGKLYIISGDLGRRGQLQNLVNGPTPQTGSDDDDQFGGPEPDENHLSGMVLRLNDDGSTPTDNPFYAAGAALGGRTGMNVQRIFAYGVRNSFGLAFDPFTGNLWETEHSDDSFDEINRIAPGHNGGWIQFMGPADRIAEFKQIELTLPPSGGDPRGGLQQFRWPPTNIANSTAEGLSRLFMLPGARYADPQYSWKFATLPVGLNFFTQRFGPNLRGNLLVNLASGPGFLLNFPLSKDRLSLATADKVDDNMAKQQLNESIPFVIGSGFGIITDIEISPSNTLFLVSHFSGAVYELR